MLLIDIYDALHDLRDLCKWFHIVVISQNQLTIFIHARSTTIADYSGINYLLQASVFRQKLDNFRLYSFNTSHEKIPDLIVYLT